MELRELAGGEEMNIQIDSDGGMVIYEGKMRMVLHPEETLELIQALKDADLINNPPLTRNLT